ncbi:MAG TPA: alkaline phosphatase D family protein, partial [Sphingomonadaceae bacterium]|nr:alkaline phosphatase D family protein [Sphingomonadaceae bacterium]
MTRFDRRALIRLLGASGASLAAGGLSSPLFAWDRPPPYNIEENPTFAGSPYTLGVASGDPSADGFVIWTRLAPRPMEPHGGMILKQIPVRWEVATDEGFRNIVRKGTAMAWPELGHSVHVEVDGLEAYRPYWYRFICGKEESPVGRSHTFPAAGAAMDRVRFAVAGCQCYHDGYFTAWRRIAEEPADFVFHYGDYIYEGVGADIRLAGNEPPAGNVIDEIYSLEDYRRRYALYKSDPDLQAAHAALPFFVSFDDHEIDNNWAAGIDENEMPADVFTLRRSMGF